MPYAEWNRFPFILLNILTPELTMRKRICILYIARENFPHACLLRLDLLNDY